MSENLRVLKWILDRVDARAGTEDTPVGLVPRASDIDLEGLEMAGDRLRAAMAIKRDDWSAELRSQDEFFNRLDCER
ncbi:MAG: phosphoenolpyruvate carboxykinase domain-containing protein [Candidatus Binataceae bacterium]